MTSLLLLGTADIVCLSVFGALFLAIIIYYCCTPIKSLFVAMFAGCYIPSFKLISLKNRKLNVSEIVSAYIMSKKSNRNLSLNEIEAFVLSGGNIINVLKALKLADDTNIKLDYKLACAIELSSKDVLQVVKNSITSTVETVEDIRAFTQDNIEVIVKAKFSTTRKHIGAKLFSINLLEIGGRFFCNEMLFLNWFSAVEYFYRNCFFGVVG